MSSVVGRLLGSRGRDEFGDRAGDLHWIADRGSGGRRGAGEDEDAFGGRRVGVDVGVGRLEEEAVVDLTRGDDAAVVTTAPLIGD